jgi:hypothetical protein
MVDLYLFNTIINTIWYIFTILFVLYRFTSFFSYIYNFVRFCGKLFSGIHYIYDQIRIYIRKRRGFTQLSSDEEAQEYLLPEQHTRHKTIFETCKEYISKQYDYVYYKVFGKARSSNFTQTYNQAHRQNTNINLTEAVVSSHEYISKEKEYERNLFDRQLSELCASNSIELTDYIQKHNKTNDSNMFQSIPLTNPGDSFLNSSFSKQKSYDNMISSNDTNINSSNDMNIDSSNALFDTQFISDTFRNPKRSFDQTTQTNQIINTLQSEQPQQLLMKNDIFPQSIKRSKLSQDMSIHPIREETQQELDENVNNASDNKVVYRIDSNYKIEMGDDYNFSKKDISYSLLSENQLDSDDEYTNEILRNPYI